MLDVKYRDEFQTRLRPCGEGLAHRTGLSSVPGLMWNGPYWRHRRRELLPFCAHCNNQKL